VTCDSIVYFQNGSHVKDTNLTTTTTFWRLGSGQKPLHKAKKPYL
jgi:hypothetical protein